MKGLEIVFEEVLHVVTLSATSNGIPQAVGVVQQMEFTERLRLSELPPNDDDSQLKWKEHAVSVSLKVSPAIGIIKYAKKLLPTETSKCFIGDWSNHT